MFGLGANPMVYTLKRVVRVQDGQIWWRWTLSIWTVTYFESIQSEILSYESLNQLINTNTRILRKFHSFYQYCFHHHHCLRHQGSSPWANQMAAFRILTFTFGVELVLNGLSCTTCGALLIDEMMNLVIEDFTKGSAKLNIEK